MIKVLASAPTRIDLAGGTLDLWPLHQLLVEKATVNVAVTLEAIVEVEILNAKSEFLIVSEDQKIQVQGNLEDCTKNNKLPLIGLMLGHLWHKGLPSLKIKTKAKSPAGAGLGGSSCLAVCVAAALNRARKLIDGKSEADERLLIATVQDVEASLIKAPTGCQDYWGAVRGGLNILRFPPGTTEVTTSSPKMLKALADDLILCYSGQSRASAINNWEIFRRSFDGDQVILEQLNLIGKVAAVCAQAAQSGDFSKLMAGSAQEWALREALWPGISTDQTKALAQGAKAEGAYLARVCGAGGGGVMAVFAPKERRAKVQKALESCGGKVLDATVSEAGLKVSHEK